LADFRKVNNEIYNVGGGNKSSVSLKELSALCQEITGNKIQINAVKENRVADIPIYITDNSKVTSTLGWTPKITPKEIVVDIFKWIKANEAAVKSLLK
jgi:CDP-paratose 2-epimerase